MLLIVFLYAFSQNKDTEKLVNSDTGAKQTAELLSKTAKPTEIKSTQPQTNEFESTFEYSKFRVTTTLVSDQKPALDKGTLQNLKTGLFHVLGRNDPLPEHDDVTVNDITLDGIMLETADKQLIWLALDPEGKLILGAELAEEDYYKSAELFTELATRGENLEGLLMIDWAQTGGRHRPALLRHMHLGPDFGGARGPDKQMVGLRASNIRKGSFWDQLGIQQGDIITEFNNTPITSFAAWKTMNLNAGNDTDISIALLRKGEEIQFKSKTVEPN